ncbi:MAG TPA: tetratricopeptide repeat protein, partial [Mucilaginibacter sp.]
MQLIASRASAQYINKEEANALVKKLGQSKSDTNRVIILVTLGKFHTYKQGKTQKDLDSSFTYLNWARQLSDTLNIKYYQHQTESMIVTLMLNQGNLAGAEIRYQALMADCDKTGDIQCKVDAMFRHAIFLSSANSNSPVAIKEFTEAAKIYHKLSEPKEEARMYYELAFINFNKGNLNLAETGLLDVVSRYKAIKSPKLSKPYNLLSTLYRIKGDFNNGLKYAMLTIDEAKKSGDTVREAYFFGDLARLYMEAGDRQEELAWYNKAVDKWERQGSAEYGMYLAQGYLITDMIDHHQSLEAFNAVRRLGKKIPPVSDIQRACFYRNLALCYDALRKYGLAEKYYLDAVNLYTKAKMDFEGSQEVYPQIGRFYLEQKQYAKAGSFLRSSLLFNPQQLSLYAIRDVHFMLFKVDSAEKNYLTAIDHQRIAKSLNDSIFNRTKVREMA